MKLILNQNEACDLIGRALNANVTEVKLENEPEVKPGDNLNLMEFVNEVRNYRFHSDQKITAIKAVRELGRNKGFSIGLADAKFFVESIR